MSKQVKV